MLHWQTEILKVPNSVDLSNVCRNPAECPDLLLLVVSDARTQVLHPT